MSQNWSVLAQSTTFMVSGWVMGEKWKVKGGFGSVERHEVTGISLRVAFSMCILFLKHRFF